MEEQELYDYFRDTFYNKDSRVKKHSRQAWNEKAGKWKQQMAETDSIMNQVTRQRVTRSVEILRMHGVLDPESSLIDIGCGPGRFVAGFAPYVARAIGTDISDEMLEEGQRYCIEQGALNTEFHVLDFKKVDLLERGWKEAFDICFSFMSPAVNKFEPLHKMMEMSRAWCNSSFALGYQSRIDDIIVEVLQPECKQLRREEAWFYNLFNLLWLEGYRPITDYYTVEASEKIKADPELIRHRIRRKLKKTDYSEEDVQRVLKRMEELSPEGYFLEETKNSYGSILWNVKDKRKM